MATAMRYSEMRRQLFYRRPANVMRPSHRYAIYVSPAENLNTLQLLSSHDNMEAALKAILYEQDEDPKAANLWANYTACFYFRVNDIALNCWYEYHPRTKKLELQTDSLV